MLIVPHCYTLQPFGEFLFGRRQPELDAFIHQDVLGMLLG